MIAASSLLLVFLIFVCFWVSKPLLDHLLSEWIDFGMNSNERVHAHMIRMVNSAKHELIIYDDGDGAIEGIYSQSEASLEKQSFVDALVSKCKKNKNFRVRILFNCFNEDLAISEAARQQDDLPNLEIKYRDGGRPNDSHFKISDGGLLCYLSNHEEGQEERKFKFMASKHKYFIPRYVRDFTVKFEKDFNRALSFEDAYNRKLLEN